MDQKFKSDNELLNDLIERIKGLYNNMDKDITFVKNGRKIKNFYTRLLGCSWVSRCWWKRKLQLRSIPNYRVNKADSPTLVDERKTVNLK